MSTSAMQSLNTLRSDTTVGVGTWRLECSLLTSWKPITETSRRHDDSHKTAPRDLGHTIDAFDATKLRRRRALGASFRSDHGSPYGPRPSDGVYARLDGTHRWAPASTTTPSPSEVLHSWRPSCSPSPARPGRAGPLDERLRTTCRLRQDSPHRASDFWPGKQSPAVYSRKGKPDHSRCGSPRFPRLVRKCVDCSEQLEQLNWSPRSAQPFASILKG